MGSPRSGQVPHPVRRLARSHGLEPEAELEREQEAAAPSSKMRPDESGIPVPQPNENPERVDERRAEVGLEPFDQYLRRFVQQFEGGAAPGCVGGCRTPFLNSLGTR